MEEAGGLSRRERGGVGVLVPRDHQLLPRRGAKTEGALCATLRYARHRLPSLNDRCAICDARHVFGSSLRPTVCTRPLCAHQLQTFGAMLVGATTLATHAEVLDLLVATTKLAAVSHRAAQVLVPPCEIETGPVGVSEAVEILAAFPSFETLNAAALDGDGDDRGMAAIDAVIARKDKRAPALLRWILVFRPRGIPTDFKIPST